MKTKILIALGLIVSLSSCKKFLDEKPVSNLIEQNYYRTTDEVETGVIACYDGLQKVYDIEFKLTEIRADNTSGVSLEGDWGAIKFFRDAPSNFFLADFWQRSYNTIARCNLVLKYINNVTDPVKKQYFEGEVKFIRSLMYFNLIRLYGDVPLITASINFDDFEKFKRISTSTIYSQIKTDLLTSVATCPPSWPTAQIARATKGASQALLAKVYLTTKDYPNAKLQLDPLVGTNFKGSTYTLNPSYAAIFSTASEMSKEILFAVRYKASSNGEGNSFSYEYSNNGDARNVKASAQYMALFESTDVRKASTYNATNGLATKFLDATAPVRDAGNDFPVIRFSDVLLMAAEVNNELAAAPTLDVLTPINEVRGRAGASLYNLVGLGTKANARDLIFKERKLEFGFENQRWYDLVRMDQASTIAILNAYLTATGNPTLTVPAYRLIFPIPQTEIDLSKGNLVQNPDYK
ncbi:RagB/SusD family nutrient uptake outer membrane protein [Pedobacter sp. MC2016-14]|uniref:RagB/SusD family nutrient uptake outer membrane protein n=1 Tax=Pedobacter sp. MC2016-14 TaxID=2897327 RepID=UPI001E36D283|nr:RagB/SusD family nutrient uptake outer membrane protein [Pedobacter sp. MC2016-14]MCD0489974.1 RagB/SusD family nutrient uptake outer membrane protein [Pedobacter sp. MC2016-14]